MPMTRCAWCAVLLAAVIGCANRGNTVLANHTYGTLGHRITSNDPVAGVTTRYHYGAQAAGNVAIGAAQGVREIGYTAADFVVITVDIPATLAGFPIDYDPLSGIGQASRTTDSTLRLTGEVAGRAGANIIALGAYNVVEGTIVYVQTGDEEALSQNVGGQGLLTLATVGAARGVVAGRAAVVRTPVANTAAEAASASLSRGFSLSHTTAIPSRLARVIEAELLGRIRRLGPPGAEDVFVSNAGEVSSISSSRVLAERLTLLNKAGELRTGPFAVIEFDVPAGIASPIFRTNRGFVGFGRTSGGASEFVVPNLTLEELVNVTTRVVP